MQEHSRYEELCAAAGAGQISPEELRDLQAHMNSCEFCRELQAEFIEVSSVWLMQTQKLEPEVYDPQSALRKKILEKLQSAGAQFSTEIRQEITAPPATIRNVGMAWLRAPAQVWVVGLIVIAGLLGFGVGVFQGSFDSHSERIVAAIPTPPAPVVSIPRSDSDVAKNAETPAVQLAETDFQQKLAASDAEKAQFQVELNATRQQLASLQEAKNKDASTVAQLRATLGQSQAIAAAAQAQLQTLRDSQAAKEADLVVAQYRIRDLETKLAEEASAQERDRQLVALSTSSEMRDVIASRNLHIIDVADVDRGGVRRPFGRIFYTEGKSLIFYAYDLSNTKPKQTFYAWGAREGDPHVTRGLGALHFDDADQKRWVFRFNDAKVLSQIDSVYVTLEPTDRPGDKPKGQKLLNAFLGTPANHP